jgi:periplasmic copper chaperone A
MLRLHALGLIIALIVATMPACAQEFKIGDITIDKPWSRATPKGAAVAGGYLVIRNTGDTPDKLLGGSPDFAGRLEIHEMIMDNGIMRMRPLTSGLEISARCKIVRSRPSAIVSCLPVSIGP